MVITRSKAKSRETLDCVASSRANPPRSASASNQNIPQASHGGGVSSSVQDPGGCLTNFLIAGNERQSVVCKCAVGCLSCPDLSRSLEVISNIAGRTYSSVNIKSHEIHCKIRTILTSYLQKLRYTLCG